MITRKQISLFHFVFTNTFWNFFLLFVFSFKAQDISWNVPHYELLWKEHHYEQNLRNAKTNWDTVRHAVQAEYKCEYFDLIKLKCNEKWWLATSVICLKLDFLLYYVIYWSQFLAKWSILLRKYTIYIMRFFVCF